MVSEGNDSVQKNKSAQGFSCLIGSFMRFLRKTAKFTDYDQCPHG